MARKFDLYGPYILLAILFAVAVLLRPALPIDETRYLSVAWEMFLQKQYAVLSLNFQPYHHKPPMLFWLINAMWEMFGISRSAALIPIFAASASVMFLTQKIVKELIPEKQRAAEIIPWLLIGSVPFLIYNTLIMFDILLTAFVLTTFLIFIAHAKNPKFYKPILAGVFMGLGVLVKGPVMYLYVLWPLALYGFWKWEGLISKKQFYKALLFAVFISAIPVAAWLVPALSQTGDDFAFWLVWNQTAGRVSGNFSSAHVRSIFFYLMILPVLFLPWCFLPSFWRNIKGLPQEKSYKFLMSATIPIFLSFCLIAGKQPHYLVPLLPFLVIVFALLLEEKKQIVVLSLTVVSILIFGQAIASQTVFQKYDLGSLSEFYSANKESDWAFVRKYQGEIGFLAKVEKAIDSIESDHLTEWFHQHPGGKAIVRYNAKDDMSRYIELFSQPYKGKYIGVFKERDPLHE